MLTLPSGERVRATLVGGFWTADPAQRRYTYEIEPPWPGSVAERHGLTWRRYYELTA